MANEPPSDATWQDQLQAWTDSPHQWPTVEPPSKSPPRPPRYQRDVSYGLGHRGRKSMLFERRSKRSFRRWLRQKIDQLGEKVDYG